MPYTIDWLIFTNLGNAKTHSIAELQPVKLNRAGNAKQSHEINYTAAI